MITSVHVPLLVSLLLAGISPVLAARLSPARAAVALVAASAAAAAASTAWALMFLAVTLGLVTPLLSARVAAHGGWFIDSIPAVLAAALVSGLGAGTVRVVAVLRRRRRVTRELHALCETCGVGREELVVAPIAHPHAFAVPARFGRVESTGGRILVTVGMLRALDAAERRALLAHERAHLICRHHRQRAIVEFAAALNPLLIPARSAVGYLVERAADEHAATTIGDRRVAAYALATAAIAGASPAGTHRGIPPDAALGYSRFGVARRVAALHAAPLPERRLPPMLLIALATVTAAETLHTAHNLAAFSVAEFGQTLVAGF